MRRALAALAAVTLLAGGTACDKLIGPAKSPFNTIDVTGTEMGGSLKLRDPAGRIRTLEEFRGKVVVVSFGYTHCPDVCPTTLADQAKAVRALGADKPRVQVLFVTVDPKRDTAELLGNYVPAFDPGFIGLRGDEAETEQATKAFHVYAKARKGTSEESYTVDHSAQSFVLDPKGKLRLVVPYGTEPAALAADLRVLMNS
jgi:protein SCO1/2